MIKIRSRTTSEDALEHDEARCVRGASGRSACHRENIREWSGRQDANPLFRPPAKRRKPRVCTRRERRVNHHVTHDESRRKSEIWSGEGGSRRPADGGEADCPGWGCLAFMPSAYLFAQASPRLLATSALAKSWKIAAVRLATPPFGRSRKLRSKTIAYAPFADGVEHATLVVRPAHRGGEN